MQFFAGERGWDADGCKCGGLNMSLYEATRASNENPQDLHHPRATKVPHLGDPLIVLEFRLKQGSSLDLACESALSVLNERFWQTYPSYGFDTSKERCNAQQRQYFSDQFDKALTSLATKDEVTTSVVDGNLMKYSLLPEDRIKHR